MLSRKAIWKSAGSSGLSQSPIKPGGCCPKPEWIIHPAAFSHLWVCPVGISWSSQVAKYLSHLTPPSLTAWLHNMSVLHKGNAKAWEVIPIQVSANSEPKLLATVVIKPDKLSLCLQWTEKSCGFTQGPVQMKENKHRNNTLKTLQWKLTW